MATLQFEALYLGKWDHHFGNYEEPPIITHYGGSLASLQQLTVLPPQSAHQRCRLPGLLPGAWALTWGCKRPHKRHMEFWYIIWYRIHGIWSIIFRIWNIIYSICYIVYGNCWMKIEILRTMVSEIPSFWTVELGCSIPMFTWSVWPHTDMGAA